MIVRSNSVTKSWADQPELPHSLHAVNGNQEILALCNTEREDSLRRKVVGEKESSHASAHQSQVTHPISFETLNGIADAFLHICCLLHHMLGSFNYPRKNLLGQRHFTTLPLFTCERVCCHPLWQFLEGREEARVTGHQAQLKSSWDSNVDHTLTPTYIPLPHDTVAED